MYLKLTKFLFFGLFIFIFGCTGTKPATVAERIDPEVGDNSEPTPKVGNSIASSIGPYEASAYIQKFVPVDIVKLSLAGGIVVDHKNKTIKHNTSYDGVEHLYQVSDGILLTIVGVPDSEEKLRSKKKYYEYLNQIGDTTYHLIVGSNPQCIMYQLYHLSYAITTCLESIEITCDKDFDALHKAGSSLNDLFFVFFDDLYTTVKNGYQSSTGEDVYWNLSNRACMPQTTIGGKLNTQPFAGKPFIGWMWSCVLEQAPQKTDVYSFQVTVRDNTGKILKTETNAMLIQGLQE